MFIDILSAIAQFFARVYSSVINTIFSRHESKTVTFENNMTVTVGETIGEGAFSFVYKAYSDRGVFALKKMYVQSPELALCARTEIEAFQRFHHSSILNLVDSKNVVERNGENVVYMLFPYMQYGSLRGVLNNWNNETQRRPKLSHILVDFVSVCDALQVLHGYNPSYVHQDIKPEVFNIYLQ
jgi:serine/threonine protein kinase